MAITPLPTPPSRSDTANFASRGDAFLGALPQFGAEANALQVDVNAKQVQAAASQTAAATSEANALASANTAASASGASAWVNGNTYALNAAAISQLNFLTYRKKTASSVTTIDPANDSTNWSLAYAANTPVTVNTQTLSANTDLTLTAASAGLQILTFPSRGRHVKLPSCLTLYMLGGPMYEIKNDGLIPFGVRDFDGNLLAVVAAGGIAYLSLSDRTTAAGKWHVTGSGLEAGLTLVEARLSSSFATIGECPAVTLSDSVSIHIVGITGSSGFSALVVDAAGKAISSPVQVTTDTSFSSQGFSMFKVSATSAVVFWTGGSGPKGAVLTLTGSSPSYSISVGPVASATGESPGSYAWKDKPIHASRKIIQLDSGLFLAAANITGPAAAARAISVSGTNIIFGAMLQLNASAGPFAETYNLVPLTTTTALVTWLADSGGATLRAIHVTVSGTTCSAGTVLATSFANSDTAAPPILCKLSATRVFAVLDAGTGTTPSAATLNISGTSVTLSSIVQLETAQVLIGAMMSPDTYQGNVVTPKLTAISATQAFGWFGGNVTYPSFAYFLTENGSSAPTVSGKSYGVNFGSNSLSTGYGRYLPNSATEVLSIVSEGNSNTSVGLRAVASKLDVSSGVTVGTGVDLEGMYMNGASADQQVGTKLSNGDYVVGLYNSRTLNLLRANGDFVQHRGTVPVGSVNALWHTVVLGGNKIVLAGTASFSEKISTNGVPYLRFSVVEFIK